MKDARLEIRINKETKEALHSIAMHLTSTGTITELIQELIDSTIEKHKKLINTPVIR
jgi:predicted DNA-binding protein